MVETSHPQISPGHRIGERGTSGILRTYQQILRVCTNCRSYKMTPPFVRWHFVFWWILGVFPGTRRLLESPCRNVISIWSREVPLLGCSQGPKSGISKNKMFWTVSILKWGSALSYGKRRSDKPALNDNYGSLTKLSRVVFLLGVLNHLFLSIFDFTRPDPKGSFVKRWVRWIYPNNPEFGFGEVSHSVDLDQCMRTVPSTFQMYTKDS